MEILDTEDRAYKQVLEEAITMEATLSNRLKHLKNLENQNIVTVPSVMSGSSCPTLTGPSNTATSSGASRNTAPGATGSGSSSSSVVNLPTLRVSKFSGDPTDWPNFWSFFDNLVHSNPHLSTVVKFTHLRESLMDQAAESICGFVHPSQDYEEAVNLLRERYGDRTIVKKQLMIKLFELSVPSTTKDSLLSFVNEVDTLMRSLKVYVKDPEDNWVIPLVLLEYLHDEVFQWVVRKVGETEVTVRDILIGRGTMQRPSKGSVDSYAVTQKGQDKDECFFCSGSGHKPANCGKVVSVEARKAKLIELRRCLRCTSTTHYATKCSARLTCEICSRFGHHTAFCYKGGKSSFRQPPRDQDPGVTSATGAKPPSSKTSKSSANSRGSKNSGGQMAETSQNMGVIAMNAVQKKLVRPDIPSCALATASCQVSKPGELQQLRTRIFFDGGSQCSFITREFEVRVL